MVGQENGVAKRIRGTHEVGLSHSARRKQSLHDVTNSLLIIKGNQSLAKSKSNDTFGSPIDGARDRSIDSTAGEGGRTPLRLYKSASNLMTPNQASQSNMRNSKYGDIGKGRTPESTGNRVPSNGGYSSLQEMLESSGFTDTRVITPITVRSKNSLDPARINYATIESPTRSNSPTRGRGRSSVYPPYVYNPSQLRSHSPPASVKKKVGGTLRPSTSIKLLRGMFSLWAPAPPLPVDDNNDMDERIPRDEDSEISEEEARSRDASRTRAQEWAESVARAALELHTSSISPQPRTVSIPTLNTTIKKHHRPQSGPTRSCPTPSHIVISQPTLNFSAPTTAEITPPRSATISVPAASSVVAFAFEPRPLLLSSASSVCSSSASSISFSSRTMGRRVFSRGDREDTDELDELRMSQFDGVGSFGDRVPILGYQSFSLGNFGAGDNEDADLAKSARRQYDDHDDDISGDLSVVEVTGEGLSASQRILSSTLKHWQSLVHFPSSILLPATTPSTTSPSPSELIKSLPPAVPLDYSPSLPRPSFLDAPYRQKPLSHSTPLRATKSTLDIRRSERVHIPATQTVRRKSSTAAMRAPALLKKLSNPALRSKAAISTVTMAYGVMS